MANEIERDLNAYLAQLSLTIPQPLIDSLSAAYLKGYRDGLTRGGELAESAWNTALEATRESEHYPEAMGNALRDYLSRPGDELLRESDGTEGGDAIEAEQNAQGTPSAWSDTHPANSQIVPRVSSIMPHAFKGRNDRDCQLCGRPDRDEIHSNRR